MSKSNYKSKHVEALNKACEIMGSQAALAKALGITSSNIAQWRNLENGVPAHHCPKIEKLTGIKSVFVKVVVTVFALKLLVVWQSLSLGLTSLVQPAHNS